jgi:D-sedoheptulose 7-phosphate isomerase
MKDRIRKIIEDSIAVKKKIIETNIDGIEKAAGLIINAYRNNRKLVLFGNGGSAADAQHFAAEMISRFEKERRSLEAIALTTNTSTITAIANDYEYAKVFTRQVEAIVKEGDVVIGISTSGSSECILQAIKQAKKQKAVTIGWTGEKGAKLREITDCCISIPSASTPRIQEGHVLLIHILSGLIEQELF